MSKTQSPSTGSVPTEQSLEYNLLYAVVTTATNPSRYDLPLNFHPAAIRASANVTPFGAMSVPA
jgi:hypothetical protein